MPTLEITKQDTEPSTNTENLMEDRQTTKFTGRRKEILIEQKKII